MFCSSEIVYKAVHTRLQKKVVIKQINNPSGELNRNEPNKRYQAVCEE